MLEEIFKEIESDILSISDFNIVVHGTQIDYIFRNENETLSFWAGHPNTDKFAEELILSEEEISYVVKNVEKLY